MSYSVKPIRTKDDEKSALMFLESVSEKETNQSILDKYDVVAELLERYQNQIVKRETLSPGTALKFFMADRNLSQKQLEKRTGIDQATLSELCNGKREFSLKQAKAISEDLGVSISYFFPEANEIAKHLLNSDMEFVEALAEKVFRSLEKRLERVSIGPMRGASAKKFVRKTTKKRA